MWIVVGKIYEFILEFSNVPYILMGQLSHSLYIKQASICLRVEFSESIVSFLDNFYRYPTI